MNAEMDQNYMGQLQSWPENTVFRPLKIIESFNRDIINIEQLSNSELTEELFLELWRKKTEEKETLDV